MSFNSYPLLKDDDSSGELISELKFDYEENYLWWLHFEPTESPQKFLQSHTNWA